MAEEPFDGQAAKGPKGPASLMSGRIYPTGQEYRYRTGITITMTLITLGTAWLVGFWPASVVEFGFGPGTRLEPGPFLLPFPSAVRHVLECGWEG